jgi:hypothetical protein
LSNGKAGKHVARVPPAYGGGLPRSARNCLFQVHRVGLTLGIGFVSHAGSSTGVFVVTRLD